MAARPPPGRLPASAYAPFGAPLNLAAPVPRAVLRRLASPPTIRAAAEQNLHSPPLPQYHAEAAADEFVVDFNYEPDIIDDDDDYLFEEEVMEIAPEPPGYVVDYGSGVEPDDLSALLGSLILPDNTLISADRSSVTHPNESTEWSFGTSEAPVTLKPERVRPPRHVHLDDSPDWHFIDEPPSAASPGRVGPAAPAVSLDTTPRSILRVRIPPIGSRSDISPTDSDFQPVEFFYTHLNSRPSAHQAQRLVSGETLAPYTEDDVHRYFENHYFAELERRQQREIRAEERCRRQEAWRTARARGAAERDRESCTLEVGDVIPCLHSSDDRSESVVDPEYAHLQAMIASSACGSNGRFDTLDFSQPLPIPDFPPVPLPKDRFGFSASQRNVNTDKPLPIPPRHPNIHTERALPNLPIPSNIPPTTVKYTRYKDANSRWECPDGNPNCTGPSIVYVDVHGRPRNRSSRSSESQEVRGPRAQDHNTQRHNRLPEGFWSAPLARRHFSRP